ncbi:PEGA domain-containing protein, partial [Myxococcota bacterium]|nr:PEGA domain-containing protein [Myxococcota bacterium]
PAVEPAPPRASDPPAWADDETLPSPPRGAADRAERGRGALALALSIATVIAIGASMWLASSRHAVVDAPADVRARDASSPWTKHATSRTVDAELPPDAEVVASAEPDTIELSVRSVPAGAEVVAPGDVVLGTTPCAVRLPRAAQTLRLELRAPGYKTLVHELVPLADRALDVTLERKPVPRPASKRRTSDDLEEPFR